MLEVVNEQTEMLRRCRSMVGTVVRVLHVSVELWEEMKKDFLLDLDMVSNLLRDDILFLVTDGFSSIRLIALMLCSTTRRMSRRPSDLMSM